MNTGTHLVIIWCWLIFIVYWIVSARGVKPVAERQSRVARRAYRIPFLVGWLLYCWQPRIQPMDLFATPHTLPFRAAGAGLCVAGLFVAIWARRTLAGNWSGSITFKQGHELIQTGPYRFARHPIYTGILLMLLGAAIEHGQLHSWLGFLIMSLGIGIKLRQEETLMLRHFPEEYPAYRRQVKAIVPFLI